MTTVDLFDIVPDGTERMIGSRFGYHPRRERGCCRWLSAGTRCLEY